MQANLGTKGRTRTVLYKKGTIKKKKSPFNPNIVNYKSYISYYLRFSYTPHYLERASIMAI